MLDELNYRLMDCRLVQNTEELAVVLKEDVSEWN